MDEFLGEFECRSESDSILMSLLRSAMDKAHDKVQSQDGPIEFLHERSQFYELAEILVQGGLNIVQKETDVPETNREKILSDLTEIRCWLQGRIKEMKLLIVEKDKELLERSENELKLRHALELKEQELVYLRKMVELERSKSEDFQEFFGSNQTVEDEAKEGNISDLKNSVDQQVWNIKQKLKDEHKSSLGRIRGMASDVLDSDFRNEVLKEEESSHIGLTDAEFRGEDHFSGVKTETDISGPDENNMVIQQMSSDIDILKETLDLAFGQMQKAQVFPLEKQWRWFIEKDVASILIRGFISNIRSVFDVKLMKRVDTGGLFKEKLSVLFRDLTTLCQELEAFGYPNEEDVKRIAMNDSKDPLPSTNSTSGGSLLGSDHTREMTEDLVEDTSHYVAKMIKSHESIIKKQHGEWNWLTREVLRGKESLSTCKSEIDIGSMKGKIQEAINKLENFIRLGKDFQLEPAGACIKGGSNNHGADSKDVIDKLEEENNELQFQLLLVDETYLLLLEGLMKDFNVKNHSLGIFDNRPVSENSLHSRIEGENEELTSSEILTCYVENAIREDIHAVFFGETVKQWNDSMNSYAGKKLVTGDIYQHTCEGKFDNSESTEDLVPCQSQIKVAVQDADDQHGSNTETETIGSLLKEDIYMVILRELVKAWQAETDAANFENLIKEEIYQFVIVEAVRNLDLLRRESKTASETNSSIDLSSSRKSDFEEGESFIQKLDSLLKFLETDEELSCRASSGIKEPNSHHDPVTSEDVQMEEENTFEWLLTDDESIFTSVSEKLDKAMQQLLTSKTLLMDLKHDVDVPVHSFEDEDSQKEENDLAENEPDRLQTFSKQVDKQDVQFDPAQISLLIQFQQAITSFEHTIHKTLEMDCLRLHNLKDQSDALIQTVETIRKSESLYKKAFITRCHNLQLAELEVDLLGDQVDMLLNILEKIYLVLHQNSTPLSQYFEVFDILKLIEKGLSHGSAAHPNPNL